MSWWVGLAGWSAVAGSIAWLAVEVRRQSRALQVLQKRVALLNRAAVHAAEDRARRRASEQETRRMTVGELLAAGQKETDE